MKSKIYFLLGLFFVCNINLIYAQCYGVDAGENKTIVCGDSTTLSGQPKWSGGLDLWNNTFEGVFFTDSLTGYVVGGHGEIRKTIDGGANWFSQTSGVHVGLRSVFFTDSNTGYVAGEQGTILKTINGGTSWVVQRTNNNTSEFMFSIYFVNASTGVAVGANGTILKTTDAGLNWVYKTCDSAAALTSVHFANASVGYIAGNDRVFKTVDGGDTWTNILGSGGSFGAIYFTNANVGYVSCGISNGNNTILKTTNGGTSWIDLHLNAQYGIGTFSFVNANTGYAGSVGKIYKTENAGASWVSQGVSMMRVATIHFPTPKVGYAVGYAAGIMAKTTLKYFEPDEVSWTPSTGLSSTTVYSPNASPIKTTTYKITTKRAGCIETDSVTVVVNPLTVNTIAHTRDMICGGSVQLDSVITNHSGVTPVTYAWAPSTGLSSTTIANPKAKPTITTTYTVTVYTGDCSATDTVRVVVNPLSVDAGVDQTIICGGQTKFDLPVANYTGNEALTYLWSPSTSLDNAIIAQPTSTANTKTVYHLTLSTPNGCVATDSLTVFVTPLVANSPGPVSLICGGSKEFNDVVTNYTGTDALTYSWLPSAGLNNSTIVKPTVTITATSNYTLTVTTSNGCQANDTVSVEVDPLTVNAGADKMNMCGDSVLLDNVTSNYTGTAPLTYSWLPATGLHNATVSNPLTGAHDLTYTVTVTTSNGCQASDQVRVDLKPMDAPEICMVGVDSTNKNVIRWNDLLWDAIDSVIIYRETTVAGNYVKIGSTAFSKNGFRDLTSQPEVKSNKYKISLLDTCGLESSKSVQHKTMHLAITKGVGTSWNLIWEPYEGFAVPTYNIYRGTDVNNLQFIDATSGTSTQFTNYNPPPGDLYYQVEVVNPNPCDPSNVAKALRSNVAASKYVGIFEQHENTFKFNLYPNPAADLVTLNAENASTKNTLIIIYNSIGAVVKSVPLQQNMQQIDVSDLSNGFYMVELKSVNGHAVQKLTIEK